MLEIKIQKEWIENSKKKAEEMGRLKHSILKGQGNITGFLGEYMVSDFLKARIENTYDYDLVKNGIKIDVKSKKCTSIPRPEYDCSVPAYNTRQKCDYYVFTRIMDDFQTGWICGIISKENFFKNARLYKKGEVDKSNWMEFKEDSYNMKIKDLLDLGRLFKTLT
jgi:hypothetical protein